MRFLSESGSNAVQGLVRQLYSDGTQLTKRMIYRLGIVLPPLRISLDLTDACNFACRTCSKWRRPDSGAELDLEDWKLVVKKISTVPLFREIAISGGEPLMRPDIFPILSAAKEAGLRIVLISNGGLISEELLDRLENVGVENLILSLNSLRESIHDSSRNTPGSHRKIMQLVDHWETRPRTMRLSLSTIVMASNVGELREIAGFVHERRLSSLLFQPLLPNEVHYPFTRESLMPEPGRAWFDHDPLWIRDLEELTSEIKALLKLQRKGYPILNPPSQLKGFIHYFGFPEGAAHPTRCLAPYTRLFIDPLGNMRLCYGFSPCGNILTDDPVEVWRGEAARQIRRASRSCAKPCRMMNCNL